MISLDSNGWLRWILMDIPEQSVVVGSVLDEGDDIAVSDVVFMEVVYVLERQYGLSRRTIGGWVRYILSLGQVVCGVSVIEQAVRRYVEHPALSFVDCYVLAVAAEEGGRVLTFDKKLVNQSDGWARLLR